MLDSDLMEGRGCNRWSAVKSFFHRTCTIYCGTTFTGQFPAVRVSSGKGGWSEPVLVTRHALCDRTHVPVPQHLCLQGSRSPWRLISMTTWFPRCPCCSTCTTWLRSGSPCPRSPTTTCSATTGRAPYRGTYRLGSWSPCPRTGPSSSTTPRYRRTLGPGTRRAHQVTAASCAKTLDLLVEFANAGLWIQGSGSGMEWEVPREIQKWMRIWDVLVWLGVNRTGPNSIPVPMSQLPKNS